MCTLRFCRILLGNRNYTLHFIYNLNGHDKTKPLVIRSGNLKAKNPSKVKVAFCQKNLKDFYFSQISQINVLFYYHKLLHPIHGIPPVDLYLISVKSIWKNHVQRTGFLVYFELDFYCLCSLQKSMSKLIFAGEKSSLSNLIFTT